MRRPLLSVLLLNTVFTMAAAQRGTAPLGMYPNNYNGSTFTGVITGTTPDSITITYDKGQKSEIFVGKFENVCSVPRSDGSKHGMPASAFPKGAALTVFFNPLSTKKNGEKAKENVILAISFKAWNGHDIPDEKRRIYYCSKNAYLNAQFY